MPCLLSKLMTTDIEFKKKLTKLLYLVQHDDDGNCVQIAEELWTMLGPSTTPEVFINNVFIKGDIF